MAKVTNPLHSNEARGRVGGLVYNTWRGLRVVKTHTPPAHEDDPKRQAHKAIVQAAAIHWRSITPDQRAAWDHYADTHFDLDWTGTPKRLAGYHWYVRIQTIRADLLQPYADNPPTDTCLARLELAAEDAGGGIILLTWDPTLADDPYAYVTQIWGAGPHSPGRTITLHDVTRITFTPFPDAYGLWETGSGGTYTVWARPIRLTGLTGPWAHLTVDIA